MDDIIYYPNKIKFSAMIGMSVIFVLVGVFFGFRGTELGVPGWMNFVVAWIGVPFFGLCAFYGTFRVLDSAPLVIINDQGVFDNASALGAGLIFWDEIEGSGVHLISSQKMLEIVVKDPKAVISRQPWYKRYLMLINKGIWNAPFNIPQAAMPVPVEEVSQFINDRLDGI